MVCADPTCDPLAVGTDHVWNGAHSTSPGLSDCSALRWRLVGVGIVAQYTIMPLLAVGICFCLVLPPELMAGFVLLGACPGGTASNVVTYLARGNVALSVSMTLVSTLLAPVLTPWITWLLAGQNVDIDAPAMMQTIVWIVAVPLGLGLLLRLVAARWVARVVKMPLAVVDACDRMGRRDCHGAESAAHSRVPGTDSGWGHYA